MSFLGDALAILVLLLVALAGWLTWRRPFLGLGILVAGMASHNFLIMGLLRLGTSHVLIRIVQGWKEAILVLLVIIAGLRLLKAYREGRLGRPTALDWVAGGFMFVMVVYLVMPSGVLHGSTNLAQRLAAFRIVALMPVLYALGRTYRGTARDLTAVAWLVLGAGAVVGAFGLVELWLVPTRDWLNWGVNLFSQWLGFQYSGPGGLPENFFQTLPNALFLRRMASTYLSPLGIAYTGLLVFPIAVVLLDRQRKGSSAQAFVAVALFFLLAGILFSVTRLALFALVGEAVLLAVVMRTRWVYVLAPVLVAAVAGVLFVYPLVGPVVDINLTPTLVGPVVDINLDPANHGFGSIISPGDPSLNEHSNTLQADLQVALRHPFGEGLGSSGTSQNRFTTTGTKSPDYAPGESAILTMFVDTGVLGGIAYLTFYLLGLFLAARVLWAMPRGSFESTLLTAAAIGGLALIPITLTNDVWGDLSVTFLFWWALGYGATLAAGNRIVPGVAAIRTPRPQVAS
jgi:hypothetical protein